MEKGYRPDGPRDKLAAGSRCGPEPGISGFGTGTAQRLQRCHAALPAGAAATGTTDARARRGRHAVRALGSERLIESTLRDLRYAIRTLSRSRTFAVTAIVSIALGIGVNALVLSAVNGVLFKPLPVTDPDRVFFVQHGGGIPAHSFPDYRDLRDRNATLDGLAGYRIARMDVDAAGSVTREWGYLATGNYFELLGIAAAAGRLLQPTDDSAAGASPFAVLSYEYWQSRFAGSTSIIGSSIRINRLAYTVLGVAPPKFYGTEVFYRPAIWVPMAMQAQIEIGNPWLENRNTQNTWVVARLAPDVSVLQAEDNLNAISRALAQEYGQPTDGPRLRLARPGLIGDTLGGPARAFGIGIVLLAGLVLLTACANLAGASAARTADRQRELAIRLSIGAGRGRIYRQMLTEAVAIGIVGGALGMLAALLAAQVLSGWQLPVAFPVQLDVRPDVRVFALVFLFSLAAGLVFGLAPARLAARTDPNAALKSADGIHRTSWPMRELLVGVQIALCVLFVTACLASVRSLDRFLTMPIGFEPRNLTIASFDLNLAGHERQQGETLRRQALERIRALPGVESAAYANALPLNADRSLASVYVDDGLLPVGSELPIAAKYEVSPGFFAALQTRILEGRELDWSDGAEARRVAVVNEAFVRQILRTPEGVGRQFQFGRRGSSIEIVGVVETGKYLTLTEPASPAVFTSILQDYNSTTVLLVRSALPTARIVGELRESVGTIDPAMPLSAVQSAEDMLGAVLLPMRAAAWALGAFAALAIMLAITGIHGLVAYAVARRRREIAIRRAVGAPGTRILRLVVARVTTLVAAGAFAGFVLAIAARRVLQSIVFGASATDLATTFAAAAILALVGVAACWAPVRSAIRLDPRAVLNE
jgi:predicted permease